MLHKYHRNERLRECRVLSPVSYRRGSRVSDKSKREKIFSFTLGPRNWRSRAPDHCRGHFVQQVCRESAANSSSGGGTRARDGARLWLGSECARGRITTPLSGTSQCPVLSYLPLKLNWIRFSTFESPQKKLHGLTSKFQFNPSPSVLQSPAFSQFLG